MTDTDRLKSRGGMPAAERAARARIAQLMQQAGLVRGSLLLRARKCGKASCHCAKGAGHTALYLQTSRDGSPVQVIVPRTLEAEVRQWVANYQTVRKHLEDMSDVYWARIAADKKVRRKKK